MGTHITSRTWTSEDIKRLEEMVRSGVSAVRASVAFRRSIIAVKSQAKKCGFPFPDDRVLQRERRAATAGELS